MKQDISYCTTSDGVRIAYASCGQGTPIVRTSHWLTHIDHDLSNPVCGHMFVGLAQNHRVIRYDARGEGLSQREVADISFDAWLRDLDAVIEAAGLDQFAIFGPSQGAATAVAYAAAHPERVTHLILYGGFARGMDRWADPTEMHLARTLILQGWGSKHDAHRQWFTSRFLPEGSADQFRWYNRMQKQSSTAEVAHRHLCATTAIDVTGLLPKVQAPTLVLHSRGDLVVPLVRGQELAAGIPGARFVPLEGENHMFLPGSVAHRQFLEEVAEFLGDPPPPRALPGTASLHQRASAAVVNVEKNWAIKLALVVGGIVGLALSVMQILGFIG